MRRGTLSLIAVFGLAPTGGLTLPTVALAEQLDCRQVTAGSASSCCPALLGSIPDDRMPRICNRVLGSGWEQSVVSFPAGSAEARAAQANGAITVEVIDAATGQKSVRILGVTVGGGSPTIFKEEPGSDTRDPRITMGGGSPTIFKDEPGKTTYSGSDSGKETSSPTKETTSFSSDPSSSTPKETSTPKESPPPETREEPAKEPTKK